MKRNDLGELTHYNPPKWVFKLRSYDLITANDYSDYIYKLFEKSINKDVSISSKGILPFIDSDQTIQADFILEDVSSRNDILTLVKIMPNICSLSEVKKFQKGKRNLILVSKSDFSKEVKEFVSTSCNNVFLVTIDNTEAFNIPLGFFKFKYNHTNIKLTSIKNPILGVLKEDEKSFSTLAGTPISELGKCLSLDKVNLMDINSFCLSHVKQKVNKKNGSINLTYKPRDKKNIYIKINEAFIKIGLEIDFDWEAENLELHMPILSYNKSQTGISLWNMETYNKNGNHQLSIPVAKYGATSAIGLIESK